MEQTTDHYGITKVQFLTELLKDPERKSMFRIFYEFTYLLIVLKAFPGHYFSRYLFKKGKKNIRNYFPWRFLYGMKVYFNNKEVREVLENKLYFDFFYNQFSLNLPKILMYNHRQIFVIGGRCHEVKNNEEFKTLLKDLFKINSLSESIIVKKTYWSYGGESIFKIFRNQLDENPDVINKLYSTTIKSGYLFQEVVKQHPEIDKLNSSCLNTIRFDTYINPDGEVDVISGYLRMSFRNSHVDNITSGGLMVGINMQTGKLKKEGFSNLQDVGVKVFTEHPVTKTVFQDFPIPYFSQAKDLVKRAASLMPDLRLVGWDVAIGESGPVLIEGNSDYENTGNDLAEEGYGSNEIFMKKVLPEYRILKKNKRKQSAKVSH